MSTYGEDWEYAHSRLAETIVRIEEVPIYVYGVSRDMLVKYIPLSAIDADAPLICHINDLDITPVPLGYCNYGKNASYLTRMPMRRDWRQGLRRGNFTSLSGVDPNKIPYTELGLTIMGSYPTFAMTLKSIKGVKSMAWHRHWALDNGGSVFYKGSSLPVGTIANGCVELDSRHHYLAEALKESL